jgi:hypothetical protein
MTFILNGGVRCRQERWIELLDKGRQGSDRWGNVQGMRGRDKRNVMEYNGNKHSKRSTLV